MPDLTPTPVTKINEAQARDEAAIRAELATVDEQISELTERRIILLHRLRKVCPTKRGPRKPNATTAGESGTASNTPIPPATPLFPVTADMTSKADVLAGKPAPVLMGDAAEPEDRTAARHHERQRAK